MILLTQQPIPLPSVFENPWFQLLGTILYFFANVSFFLGPRILDQLQANTKKLEMKVKIFNLIEEKLDKCIQSIRQAILSCKYTLNTSHIFSAEATKDIIVKYFQTYFLDIQKLLLSTLEEIEEDTTGLEVDESQSLK